MNSENSDTLNLDDILVHRKSIDDLEFGIGITLVDDEIEKDDLKDQIK